MNLSKINIFQIITLIISIAFLATIKCQDILSIPNFDIREKFRDCYNEGYSSDYDEILCTTNWPIQFTLLLTDKTCILSGKKNRRLISSMNINSCMPIGDNIQNCRDLSGFYSLEKSTRQIITDTINFFNTYGGQYEDENPYKILRDSEELPGYFPECVSFTPSVKLEINPRIEYWNDSVAADFVKIKRLMYEEGPILAMIDNHAIYFPSTITPTKHDGFKFLRVVGWRTLLGKLYWVFSFTQSKTWGLENYKLIPQGIGLTFMEIKINSFEKDE